MKVVASNVRRSSCVDVDGAVDITVIVTMPTSPPTDVAGEVTLAPRQHDGQLAAFGDAPDHWISGDLLRQLQASVTEVDFRAALDEIEAAAIEVE